MDERTQTTRERAPWQLESTGPATLAQVMEEVELQAAQGEISHLRPMATGFDLLDGVLNGGLRRGDLLVIGGPFGVGKTIWGLQVARNAVTADKESVAVYICYEHDRAHLMSRLLCMESAEQGLGDQALTLRSLGDIALDSEDGVGPISRLRRMPRYAALVQALESYADRLVLVKASGDHSSLDHIRRWIEEIDSSSRRRLLVVVDYLQKIPVKWSAVQQETEVTTYLTQGLKEMAMSMGIRVVAVAASDREGLKAKRMRLADLRGSSALQYEADIGLMLNNKFAIVSREHLVYNPTQGQEMRNWVVMSVEKNRSGRNAVDMEYALDAAHFRIVSRGRFVRERLVDERVTLL